MEEGGQPLCSDCPPLDWVIWSFPHHDQMQAPAELLDEPALAVGDAQIAIDVGPDAGFKEVLDARVDGMVGRGGLDVADGPHVPTMPIQHVIHQQLLILLGSYLLE